ncbi:DUF3488 and DUF4129 domain-containing transglutaminase family protein [Halobaculum sp. MBLA0143]|uniref:transglutaminase TgpA family protein n=1 Tax=Halobaculum sp. MBLA0143 TaxID=3079933 RepID=UPI00352356FB
MSGTTRGGGAGASVGGRIGKPPGADDGASVGSLRERLSTPATAGVVAATLAYLSVFYHVTDVVGGVVPLGFEIAVAVGLGLAGAVTLRERTALAVALVGFAAALGAYVLSVPESQRALFTVGRLARDLLALASGLSVLRLVNAGAWALSLAPVPTFVVAYLTGRGRHVWAATLAAAATGFFVLTGDAGLGATLAGAVGLTAAVGLAGLAAGGRRGLAGQWDTVVVIVTAMVVVTSLVTVVPGSAQSPIVPGGGAPSVESSLVSNDQRVAVLGSISLSPSVRFTVESNRPAYWRVGAYDRYTGGGWVRTGESSPYRGAVEGPPGESVRVEQTYTVRTKFDAVPAAYKPVRIRGETRQIAQVTSNGGFAPATTLAENESYTVISRQPSATTAELRRTGVDYPAGIQSRYTQLPGSTPDRVRDRTQQVLQQADASTPYDAAVAVERYLESTKEYSLNVPNPDGSIADSFLFEMESGYCTYYATTMVTMLRSQGIPARFVTGYTTGQRVGPDEYVVRGLDSHAWVEVYFPDVGWVRFDPTPAAERTDAERSTVAEAREAGASNVDTAGSADGVYTTPAPTFEETADIGGANGTDPNQVGAIASPGRAVDNGTLADNPFGTAPGGGGGNATTGGSGDGAGDGGGGLPSRRETVLGVTALAGVVAGARRLGLTARGYRLLWTAYQPSGDDPTAAAERAYRRLEATATRRYRERRPGETPRQYVDNVVRRGLDEDAQAVARAYELAHYGPGVDETTAAETVATVDRIVRDGLPVIRRLR